MTKHLLTCLYVGLTVFGYVTATNRTVFNLNSSDFALIRNTSAFVDKTLLIKTFIESEYTVVITAPPKFGKSTNINMLKKFLEIEVDKSGIPKTTSNYVEDLVTDTKNFKLFSDHTLNIMEYPEFVGKHFGKTPVILVDFKLVNTDGVIRCVYDVVRHCKEVVHNSFKEHEYLMYSDKLTEDHKQYVQMWCDEHSYKTKIDTLYVSHSLHSLAQYLHKHFNGRKVVVLIDNYDYVVSNASSYVTNEVELNDIIRYAAAIISDVLKENGEFVDRVLITGVSKFNFLVDSVFTNCSFYEFLGNHKFVSFFGFTKEEVNGLFNMSDFNLIPKEVEVAHSYYSGYQSKRGVEIYNLFSILSFLKTGEAKRYFTKSGSENYVRNIINIHLVKKDIDNLLHGKSVHIEVPVKLTVSDLILYNGLLRKPDSRQDVSYSLLFILLDWAYLTYASQEDEAPGMFNTKFVAVKIPNNEIKEFIFSEQLTDFTENL